MSISSFITEASFHVEFPRLMNLIERPGLVLLFSAPGVATVVAVPHAESIHTVGDHSTGWVDDAFEVFNGELNLCNEADGYTEELDGEGHALGGLVQSAPQAPKSRCAEPAGTSCPDCPRDDKTQVPEGAFVRAISLDQLLSILKSGGEVKHA